MFLIGDYSWVLTAVFSTLGVLLAVYFVGLFVWSRINRARSVPKTAKPRSAGIEGGGEPIPSH